MNETRTTSVTGGQKGVKAERLGAIDPLAMQELGKVAGMGEEKYDRFNFLKGYEFSKSIDALLRHLMAFAAGEDRDPESGYLHTAHVAWHGLALTSFMLREIAWEHPEFDDRAPRQETLDPRVYTDCEWNNPFHWCAIHPKDRLIPIVNARPPLRTDEIFTDPECCEYACYEDPGCLCEGCAEVPFMTPVSEPEETFLGQPLSVWKAYGIFPESRNG